MKSCVVCGRDGILEGTSVNQRTSYSQTRIAFRLYSSLKEEFLTGSVCSECLSLIEEADELEFKLNSVNSLLKAKSEQKEDDKYDLAHLVHDSCDEEENASKAKRMHLDDEEVPANSDFWQSVNNPALLAPYLASGKVDSNLTISTTQRGEDQLIYNGHVYRKKVYTPSMVDEHGGIFKWRCVKHHKKDNLCKGQIATTMDGLCVLLDSVTEHNHAPDQVTVNGILFRERLRTIALNHPKMKTSEILSSAEMLMGSRVNVGVKDDKSLHRFIQRVRAKQSKLDEGQA